MFQIVIMTFLDMSAFTFRAIAGLTMVAIEDLTMEDKAWVLARGKEISVYHLWCWWLIWPIQNDAKPRK